MAAVFNESSSASYPSTGSCRLALVPLMLVFIAGCGVDRGVPPAPVAGESVSRDPHTPPASPTVIHQDDGSPATDPVSTTGSQPSLQTAMTAPLSRADCVRLALVANRNYLQKDGARERARWNAVIAQANLYRPTLKADYTKTIDAPDGGSGRLQATLPVYGVEVKPFANSSWDEEDDEYTSAYGIAFSRRVFALAEDARLRLPLSQAEVDYLASAYELLTEAKRLEREVTRSFLSVQNAQAKVKVRAARVTDARAFLDNVELNVQHGFRPKADRLFAEISLNQAEADLVREQTNERDAAEQLLMLLAYPLDTRLGIVDENLEDLPTLPADFNADLLAVQNGHEDILVQDARLRLFDDRIRIARDEVAPEVTATLSTERRLTGTGAFASDIEDEDRVSLRLDLNMPLDGQRSERARLMQLRREAADLRLARAETAAKLEQQLRSSWRGWERNRTEANLAVARVATERARLEAVLARYEAGEVDNLEVTRAKQSLDDAEVRLLDARIGLANSAAEYRAILPARTPAP